MWVSLPDELEPSERITLSICFTTILPDGGLDRAGVFGNIENQSLVYLFASCYPIPCVYDTENGWDTNPYLRIGDPTYYDAVYYDLIVELPEDMIIAATGILYSTQLNTNTKKYHFKSEFPVREITFAYSEYFIIESMLLGNINRNINTTIYYLPNSPELWNNSALNILDTFFTSTGGYPYPSFNVITIDHTIEGFAYPCQIYVRNSIDYYPNPSMDFEAAIVRETIHQFFGVLTGFNEIKEPFLDEGLVAWFTDYWIDGMYPETNLLGDFDYSHPYYRRNELRYHYFDNGTAIPSKINRTCLEYDITEFGFTDYDFTVQTKTAVIWEKLRTKISHETFFQALTLFSNRFSFKIASTTDFQTIIEEVTGENLDWFFNPWFNNDYLPLYDVKLISFDEINYIIGVTIFDQNQQLHVYNYSQEVQVLIYDIRIENILFHADVLVNGTTSLKLKLNVYRNPGRLVLVYEQYETLILNQFSFNAPNVNYLEYEDISWYKTPSLDWVACEAGEILKWNYEGEYQDERNFISNFSGEGNISCEIQEKVIEDNNVKLVTNISWSESTNVLDLLAGNWNFTIDQEGFSTPYYLSYFSLITGKNFLFTSEWFNSLRANRRISFRELNISKDGLYVNAHYIKPGSVETWDIKAEYDSNGIIKYLLVEFNNLRTPINDFSLLDGSFIIYQEGMRPITETVNSNSTPAMNTFSTFLIFCCLTLYVKKTKEILNKKRNV
jgi:hypothetical protein